MEIGKTLIWRLGIPMLITLSFLMPLPWCLMGSHLSRGPHIVIHLCSPSYSYQMLYFITLGGNFYFQLQEVKAHNFMWQSSQSRCVYFADLLVGYFIRTILKLRGVPDDVCTYSVMAWLFNPFTFTIGTRGNCEPIVCAVILWIITCIMRGKVYQAAVWYGLIVHFRIYPIIYALPLILVLDSQYLRSGQKPMLTKWSSHKAKPPQSSDVTEARTFWTVFLSMFSSTRIMFGLISGSIFLGCTCLFYYLYGMEFLHEALLYHLTRTDPRHNFSIYFYHIYLNYERELSVVEKVISFLPQFAVQLVLMFNFALDLPFCFLIQTVAFVAFNKVITAQYFVWFFSLLPVIMPWSKMKMKWEGLLCILFWIGTQLHWLLWGYLLEFKGKNVFLQLWIAGLLFLAANTYVLIAIIRCHRYSPIFQRLNSVSKTRLKVK